MKIIVIGGAASTLVGFRGVLLHDMITKGHEVYACAGDHRDGVKKVLGDLGVKYFPVYLSRASMRPWDDLRTFWEFFRLFCSIRPDVVLTYTIKPVVWGGLASWCARVPVTCSLITGIGYAFVEVNSFRGKIARIFASMLYYLSLKRSKIVFFQNPDDQQEFVSRGLVNKKKCLLVNGSGIDLNHYSKVDLPTTPKFLMVCRLLLDKGIREYVQASRNIRRNKPSLCSQLAGPLDSNPSCVSQAELEQWCSEKVIEYLGELQDVRPTFSECSVFVLPSYREGTPRVVLEAMAMGRPIITTDAPGCRETVPLTENGREQLERGDPIMEGENGFLVKVKNVEALQLAMEQFINNPELIIKMGERSRAIAEEKYDVHTVNKVMLDAMGIF